MHSLDHGNFHHNTLYHIIYLNFSLFFNAYYFKCYFHYQDGDFLQ